ncbi:hypothetical protein ODS41_02070 [Pyrobaculum sp. 3827-6]|uniref:hypothetical protein n=1 Tax=Pyrobaculum sp. 3827-6 TaxID=2983604 RepID=UPI0021D7FCD3|nr:hypothetical protein [Pyrobaculum sp. 3827-6]MCU7786717.1 hypothetical protein [Pyrobaculum sp. 3827-6]
MDIVPTILLFFLVVALVATVSTFLFPLLDSAKALDVGWQLLKVSNIYNFREALYVKKLGFKISWSSNCAADSLGATSYDASAWYLAPHPMESLTEVKPDLTAVFKEGEVPPYGSHISTETLYGVKYIAITFTNITNIADEKIYGSPLALETIDTKEITIIPKESTSCTVTISAAGREVYSGSATFIKLYIRQALAR